MSYTVVVKQKRRKMSQVSVRDVLKVFWRHMRPRAWSLFWIFAFILLDEIMYVVIPLYYKQLIDSIATLPQFDTSTLQTLFFILVLIVALRIMATIFVHISLGIAGVVQPKIMTELLQTAQRSLLQQSVRFFSNSFSGSLVQKAQRFGRSFSEIVNAMRWNIFPAIVTTVGILFVLSKRSLVFVFFVLIWMVFFILFHFLYSSLTLKYQERRAKKDSQVSGFLHDSVSNSMNVTLFTGQSYEERGYRALLHELRKCITLTWNLSSVRWIVESLFNITVEFIVLYYAFQLWSKGLLTIGDIVLIQAYLLSLFGVVSGIGHVISTMYENIADAKEMVEIINMTPEIRDARGAKELRVIRGKIEFKNVVFHYGKERRILDEFSLQIAPREKTALIGPSGAGKTTVVKLLLRFFDVVKGSIRIDGKEISKVKQDSLRDQIAYVPQEPILFHRSLMENIQYGRRDATEDEVIDASIKAHCHEFISKLPEGYDTKVGERGIKLSGGERQRVAIARAILKDARILVLDEATSSLDSESELFIQDALEKLMKDKTVIVIAHRLSTIMKMDRIVVIENGKVVDAGSHEELLQKVGVYSTLWEIQAGGFQS